MISNGIPTDRYARPQISRKEWRAREGFGDDDVLFVCVARFAPQKNHALLLKAFAQGPASDPNAHLVLVGEGALRKQLEEYTKRDNQKIAGAATDLVNRLTAVEENLYQTKNRASEDPLNFPIKLNNKLAHVLIVVQSSDAQPTAQSYMVYEDLATAVNGELKTLEKLTTTDLAAFNKLIRDENVPAVQLPVKK